LSDLPVNEWIVAALSEESIRSGTSGEIYERVERRRNAIRTLSNEKESIAEDVRGVVVDHVGDVVSQPVESLSKNLVDDLIEDLESSRRHKATGDDSPKKDVEERTEANRQPTTPSGEYSARVASASGSADFTDDSQTEVMAEVVDYLIDEHGLIEEYTPLPYVPGKKIAMLNDTPTHPTGEGMRTYRAVGNGYYVYTSLNKKNKKRHLADFAESCGVTVEFDGNW